MDKMETANIVIIGGGIVGLSIASEISKKNDSVYLLEKNWNVGLETSTRNSGVIHSGIYYPKNTLKSILSISGNNIIYDIAKRYGIAVKRVGKIIGAMDDQEIDELEKIMKNGIENNIEGLKFLEGNEIKELEPKINFKRAIYVPSTGIIDPTDLINYFYNMSLKNNVNIVKKTEVKGIKKIKDYYEISGISADEKFTIRSRYIINSAGLNSDKIASMVGLDIDKLGYKIHYCKGDYYRISGNTPVRMLVYPVPDRFGLGIHLTPDIYGTVRIGPNAYYVDRIDYKIETEKNVFINLVKKYMPDIINYNIEEDFSGIRPKLQGPNEGFRDFTIKHEDDNDLFGFINLIGIESPGLTASPAIGKYVSEMFENEVI